MDSLKVITIESATPKEEGSIAINIDIQGNPILEYYKKGSWVPLDNLKTTERMSRLDDLYTHLYYRNWGIGPRFSVKNDKLFLHTELCKPIPVLSGGVCLSEFVSPDESIEDMNKEIDIYYNSLVSSRDLLEGSSVVDIWEYPTEYGGTLNLMTLPVIKRDQVTNEAPIIRLGISWVIGGVRKSENITFTPWVLNKNKISWSEFQSPLGESEVIVEFHDGCIRVFPGIPEVTECLIHHCSATYDKLL